MAKKEPWELERETKEVERVKNVYALQTALSEKQRGKQNHIFADRVL